MGTVPATAQDLDTSEWKAVFYRIENSHKETLEKKAARDAENERLRRNQETDRLLRELEASQRSNRVEPWIPPQPVQQQNQYDPYAPMQKQLDVRQQHGAQRRAEQGAAQQQYKDNLFGRGQQSGTPTAGADYNRSRGNTNSGQKPAGFQSAGRSRMEGGSSLRAADVQATQEEKPKVKYCSCSGGDWNEYGASCLPIGGSPSDSYTPGYYTWTPQCRSVVWQ